MSHHHHNPFTAPCCSQACANEPAQVSIQCHVLTSVGAGDGGFVCCKCSWTPAIKSDGVVALVSPRSAKASSNVLGGA